MAEEDTEVEWLHHQPLTWLYQPLVSPVTVASGSALTLPAGTVVFTFAGNWSAAETTNR